jgi:hypothetical protein
VDRRFAVVRAIPEARALDAASDIVALTQEGRAHLVRAHAAHVRDDWGAYLDAVDGINTAFVRINTTARRWATDITAAPLAA